MFLNFCRFKGERAKEFLIKFSKIGIKVPGSYELELQAVDLFDNEIQSIIKNANNFNKIAYDKQNSSGSYYLAQSIGYISSYNNVHNLIVKIGPHNADSLNDTAGLLINCHYDSAPSSPGKISLI